MADTATSDKSKFAEEILNNQSEVIQDENWEERNTLFLDLISRGASDEELVTNGFFEYQGEVIEKPMTRGTNAPSDVEIAIPNIYFDSVNNQWKITATGYWKNDSWDSGTNLGAHWNCPIGTRNTLGGPDLYGFVFTDVAGDYTQLGVSLIHSSVVLNKLSAPQVSSSSRIDGSGRGGVVLFCQDYVECTDSDWLWYSLGYVGKSYTVVATYNSAFADYQCNVSGYYAHTYDTTQFNLSGLKLSGSKEGNKISFGVELSFSSSQISCSWAAYSGGNRQHI